MNSSKNTKEIGEIGELVTSEYYLKHGYVILYKNWRWSNKGELDIIACHKESEILVICEVKTRKSGTSIKGRYSVNYNKQNKIKILTSVFLQKFDLYKNYYIRFDVADLIFNSKTNSIEEITIIENAF